MGTRLRRRGYCRHRTSGTPTSTTGTGVAPTYATRWVGGVNDGTTGATDAWQSATPVVDTGLIGWNSGQALHISVPADGSSTPGGTATAPTDAYQRCEQYPDLSAVPGVSGGVWGNGFTGYFGLSVKLDTDFPINPRETGGGVAWQVITQWKNDGTGSPPVELKIGGSQLFLDGNSGGWSVNIAPVTAGNRYDIILGLTFSEAPTTSTANVWVNGTQYLTNFHPTGAGFLYTGVNSYWKAGIYRETGLPTQAKASLWYGALCFDATQTTVAGYLTAT